ncbi:MAG: alpha-(1-_3)-arabinofuranosyltransferase [Actinobacteria bacterium]|nr:alpha-(1->3)-arabinofuranosyltransferase [Actinomycetota bacterium]
MTITTATTDPRHRRTTLRSASQAWILILQRIGESKEIWVNRLSYLILAAIAFIPLLLTGQGVVAADTKAYLYIDPGRFILQSASMWNPNISLGTVTHETIGYLFPMGPFFWATKHLGIPIWASQRLWAGCLLFFAGAGVNYLARTLQLKQPGAFIAALAYMLSPYALQYIQRMSVILSAWSGLGFLVAFTVKALRQGGLKYPALFALVVLMVSGINATAILYTGLAPVLWLVYAVIAKEASWKRALATAARIGVLTLLVSLWWMSGLYAEARYGVNVLRYTETVPAIAETSLASEVLRGLGYWYFYGGGALGPWLNAAVEYTTQLWLIAISFTIPTLALLAGVVTRWRHRTYLVIIGLVGLALSVGTHPFNSPSPFGAILKLWMLHTTEGMAMRSTDRATPLVVLALAMLLGAGVQTVWTRWHKVGAVSTFLIASLILANNPPLFNGNTIAADFTRPEHLPKYYYQAANYLDRSAPGTRVLALPGSDFAAHRWGDTIDAVMPGLLHDRPYVLREQIVQGSLPTTDLLYAIDIGLQNGTFNLASLAPLARLISAGDVLIRSDLQYERYNTPRPRVLWATLNRPATGLSKPVGFGTPRPNVSLIAMLDEQALGESPKAAWPPPLAAIPVAHPLPLVRANSLAHPLVIDGNATGLVEVAGLGLLGNNPTIFYQGTLDTHPNLERLALTSNSTLVLTDSNRKEGFRWESMSANAGYTETTHHHRNPDDYSNVPLNIFPHAPQSAQTVAVEEGVKSITASSYGNPITFIPEDRPSNAFDGDVNTTWQTGAFSSVVGQWIQVVLDHPVTTSHITLVQPIHGGPNRWITKVKLTFDGKRSYTVRLNGSSRTPKGQVIHFPTTRFSKLRITIEKCNRSQRTSKIELSSVGFAEISIPGVHMKRLIKMPTDMLKEAGKDSIYHRLIIIMNRRRVAPYPPRQSPERSIDRLIWLPTARTFELSGTARISALIPDFQIDHLLGQPSAERGGVTADSLGRLPGDLNARSINAIDGDPQGNPSTFWSPGFGISHQIGTWITYTLPHPTTFSHMTLDILADGRHSVPTKLKISAGGKTRLVKLGPIADAKVPNATASVNLSFPPLTGRTITITIEGVRPEYTKNYYSRSPIGMPVGISKIEINGTGLHTPPLPRSLPGTCQSNLVKINGKPVDVAIVGSTSKAAEDHGMHVVLCGADRQGITLHAGYNTVTTTRGHISGWNIDQLVLDSAPKERTKNTLSSQSTTLGVHVSNHSATSMTVHITGARQPFFLVLGESINPGWQATLSNGTSLGKPVLIDGFANGYYVSRNILARYPNGSLTVVLRWTPQRVVDIALFISGLATLVCLALAIRPSRKWIYRLRRRGDLSREQEHIGSREQEHIGKDGGIEITPAITHSMKNDPAVPDFLHHSSRSSSRTAKTAVSVMAITLVSCILITPPWVGLAVGILSLIALSISRMRHLPGVTSVVSMAIAGSYVVYQQWRHHFPTGGYWPAQFGLSNTLAWLAMLLLVAEVMTAAIRSTKAKDRTQGSG